MTTATKQCKAITQSGARCEQATIEDSDYCPSHAVNGSEYPEEGNEPAVDTAQPQFNRSTPPLAAGVADPTTPEMEMLKHELDALAREFRTSDLRLKPSDISPAGFMGLFNRTVGKRLPTPASELLGDVERNLEDASFVDFADPDVLRGMALLTYYSVQAQTEPLREPVAERLQQLPGFETLNDLRKNLEGTSLQDLTDPDTWVGIWYLASYSARTKLLELLKEYEERN